MNKYVNKIIYPIQFVNESANLEMNYICLTYKVADFLFIYKHMAIMLGFFQHTYLT